MFYSSETQHSNLTSGKIDIRSLFRFVNFRIPSRPTRNALLLSIFFYELPITQITKPQHVV